jgi:Glycogen synthase
MDLDPVLKKLGNRFGGILNGLDMTVWDPATDDAIPARYSRSDLAGKAVCRRELLTEIGFNPEDDGPVLGMIGRLDPQKGFDLLTGAAAELLEDGARIVVLGTGDPELVAGLQRIGRAHPNQVAALARFDRSLARRIYAGSDFYVCRRASSRAVRVR